MGGHGVVERSVGVCFVGVDLRCLWWLICRIVVKRLIEELRLRRHGGSYRCAASGPAFKGRSPYDAHRWQAYESH